jgi:DMSO/TMAO reductase YedYZ heme-binding membrane subunit
VQRLVYVAVVLDVWHVAWAKKNAWEVWPAIAIAAMLLLLRIPPVRRMLVRLGELLHRRTET